MKRKRWMYMMKIKIENMEKGIGEKQNKIKNLRVGAREDNTLTPIDSKRDVGKYGGKESAEDIEKNVLKRLYSGDDYYVLRQKMKNYGLITLGCSQVLSICVILYYVMKMKKMKNRKED